VPVFLNRLAAARFVLIFGMTDISPYIINNSNSLLNAKMYGVSNQRNRPTPLSEEFKSNYRILQV
jgi:hypothetical protein